MVDSLEQDRMIAHFISLTGIAPSEARQYLELNSWNLEIAVSEFLASHDEDGRDPDYEPDEDEDEEGEESPHTHEQLSRGGGRRLGDGPSDPQPIPVASSSSSSQPKKKAPSKKFATLGDVNATGNEDDPDDSDERQNLFAGGEKSGLAVQNPDEVKKKIIEKAMKGKPPPTDTTARPNHFRGPAQTLGGDDAPSRTIAQPPQAPSRPERVERVLHFWNNGFSVDDGDLYRSDDPNNAQILNNIRQGRAPLSIMNVQPGQEVDVEIKQHEEDYTKPTPKYKPFAGGGNRLGSPTPGAPPMPGSFETSPAAAAASTPSTAPASSEVDPSKPVLTLRISLGSGARLTARFNTTQTIGDVYTFVSRAEAASTREWVLQTTFPNKEFRDHGLVLGEINELKRGGAVVQKYI